MCSHSVFASVCLKCNLIKSPISSVKVIDIYALCILSDETSKINGIKPTEKATQPTRIGDPRHLRGDYSQLQVTRHERNMHIKGRRSKTFVAADVSN